MEICERLEEQSPGWDTTSDYHKLSSAAAAWFRRIGKWRFQPLESLEVGDLFLDALKARLATDRYQLHIVTKKTRDVLRHKNLETGVITEMSPEHINEFPIVIKLLEEEVWRSG